MALIKCIECKKKISDSVERCPRCGATVSEEMKSEAKEMMEKRKKNRKIFIAIILIFVLAAGTLTTLYFIDKNGEKIEQQEKEKKNQELAKEQDQKTEKDFLDKSINLLSETTDFYEILLQGSVLIAGAWYNSIFEIRDDETDKYTINKKGKFRDFNEAVEEAIYDVFRSDDFENQSSEFSFARNNYQKIELSEEQKEKYKDQIEVIDNYVAEIEEFYTLLQNPTGTWDTFSQDLLEKQEKIKNTSDSIEEMINNGGFSYAKEGSIN